MFLDIIFEKEITPIEIRQEIYNLNDLEILRNIAKSKFNENFLKLSHSHDQIIRENIMWNEKTPENVWRSLLSDNEIGNHGWPIRFGALNHNGCPEELIEEAMNDILRDNYDLPKMNLVKKTKLWPRFYKYFIKTKKYSFMKGHEDYIPENRGIRWSIDF